jgi:hypothetical protein
LWLHRAKCTYFRSIPSKGDCFFTIACCTASGTTYLADGIVDEIDVVFAIFAHPYLLQRHIALLVDDVHSGLSAKIAHEFLASPALVNAIEG